MTSRELFEAIGLVDDALVLEADGAAVRRAPVLTVLRRYAPLAACLCVFVGAVLVWRSDFGRMGSKDAATGAAMDATADAGAAEPEAVMAPQEAERTADAAEDDAAYSGSAGSNAAPDALADGTETTDAAANKSAYYCLLAPSLPQELTGALTAGDGGGSYALMAYGPEELYFADPLGDAMPETLPVYRSVMADQAVHEGDMRAALGQVLAGLAVDDTLAETAVLTSGTPTAENGQAVTDKAAAQGGNALSSETQYWGGIATLTLADDPALTAAGVERITVYNDLEVSIFFAGDENAELDLATDIGDAERQAAAVQKGHARLLQYLGVNTAALEGGDRDIYGEQSGVFSAFYAAGQDGHAYPAAVESLLDYSYRRVLAASNTDGTLSTVHWNAAGPGTLLGEYPVLSKDEALELLRSGQCYGSYDERVGCQSAADAVLNARLVYTDAAAAYHVPVWEFMVEAGAAQSDDAAALGLKDYVFYYVPAVDAATLTELIEENG